MVPPGAGQPNVTHRDVKPANIGRMDSGSVFVLNEYGLTARTSPTGRTRVTVEIKSEPIVINADPKALGRGPADAIANLIRGRITAITATAAPATIRARASAVKAFHSGKAWAMKRYGGGKLGAMGPGGTALFNDSGRLAKSIKVGATSESYIVNVAANRFNGDTLDNGGPAALAGIVAQLRSFVPELGDASALMSSIPIRRAIQTAMGGMVKKLDAGTTRAKIEVVKQLFEIARSVAELAA